MASLHHIRRSVFDRVLDLLVAMLCCECSRRSLSLSRPSFFSATRCFLGAALMCGRVGGTGAPQKISATFTFIWWSKKPKFGHIQHGPLVNTSQSKCSSVTIYIQNLTKLQDLMSHTLSHTFHSKSQPYNYLAKSMASICTKRHYLHQALYIIRSVLAVRYSEEVFTLLSSVRKLW